jgi:BirA family biotin operon repressor/biotin-[acetyl-CoA-carboxylase] ligase
MTPHDLDRLNAWIANRGLGIGRFVNAVEQTASTNDDAKRGARAGAPHGALWLAEAQTHGRGRHGRAWHAAPGESLLMSVLFRLACNPQAVPPLSLAAGLAVRDAVAEALGSDAEDQAVRVKWPNDVLVRDRKVAGVLIESAIVGGRVDYVVVGIGINTHTQTFPDEIAHSATSVARECAAPVDRVGILAAVLATLENLVERVAHGGLDAIHTRLARYDALAGRLVESVDTSGQPLGTACGIDRDGRLLVRAANGDVTKISSGEVRLRAHPHAV